MYTFYVNMQKRGDGKVYADLRKNKQGAYLYSIEHHSWKVWQAATAAVELDRAQRGEPVAWIWRFSDGELHKTPFGTLAECERDAIGYDGSAVPLYTAPQPSQPAHTEAEVQELMEFAKHHALGTFSDATIEDKFRRVLGVPKP